MFIYMTRQRKRDMDGRIALAAAIVFAVIVGGWMFRYDNYGLGVHKNRFTGAACFIQEECWFSSDKLLAP
jgi:hypothetical protein